MQMEVKKERERLWSKRFIDSVFSWSLEDVLNKDLYNGQVQQIPETFMSAADYLKAFIPSLLEETHAELFSSVQTLSRAPFCQIMYVEEEEGYHPTKHLPYEITLKRKRENGSSEEAYEPQCGDLIALTEVKPRCIDDLNRPKRPYLIALVDRVNQYNNTMSVVSSKPVVVGDDFRKKKKKKKKKKSVAEKACQEDMEKETLFAVYLTNLTTNTRIWNALDFVPELETKNMKLIKEVLQNNIVDNEDCSICSSGEIAWIPSSCLRDMASYNLNESQKAAVMSCVARRGCFHQSSVKLIWGPPGTGKTKTISCLLHSLFKMKCRTLTCAPTNIAVLEVAARVLKSIADSLEHETYGTGDVLLFGNQELMKIDDDSDLLDVFLNHHADMLEKCLHPSSGWKGSLAFMICLLEDPEGQYRLYLRGNTNEKDESKENEEKEEDANSNEENMVDYCTENCKSNNRKTIWKEISLQALKGRKESENKQKTKLALEKEKQSMPKLGKDQDGPSTNKKDEEKVAKKVDPLTFDEFVRKKFKSIGERLKFCIVHLCTHLPTSFLPLEAAKNMIKALDLMKSYETLLFNDSCASEQLTQIGHKYAGSRMDKSLKLHSLRKEFLHTLKLLPPTFQISQSNDRHSIKQFCLANACLLFCTASGSAKLHVEGMQPVQMLIIDEASQLKECESAIPLQLSGLHHAILIGDERQLPAMVNSEISEKAQFGRSLFKRLVSLGCKKHLLNIQYRMHPSISLFPNKEFYNKQILDAPNVKKMSYQRHFLKGNMYGSYSFINICHGKEELDEWKSLRNVVEVAVIDNIVARLFEEFIGARKKISIGVISPYKAQVKAIQEKIGKYTSNSDSGFSVNVRSVDGFQGGEEDVIIVSTVRCNKTGHVGFLSNCQRANVAITRARNCLWILGNETTLVKSRSVWEKLVNDAKERGCFYNAEEDKCLSRAITDSLIELHQLNIVLGTDSVLFRNARWKIIFSDGFHESVTKVMDIGVRKEAVALLEKLADGWRPSHTEGGLVTNFGPSSQLLKHCRITDNLMIVWTVDILQEHLFHTQVMKVWAILPSTGVQILADGLDVFFRNYSAEKMKLCQYKCMERNLVVPMRWPVNGSGGGQGRRSESDAAKLSREFSMLNLNGNKLTASTANHKEHCSLASNTRVPLASNVMAPSLVSRWVRWLPPHPPYLKLNTDGSLHHHTGRACAGGLIRDYTGRWIHGFAMHIGHTSSFLAELWGCREGLQLAHALRISHLVLELDSLLAVQYILQRRAGEGPIAILFDDIFSMLDDFTSCIVLHSLREGNSAADFMASIGHTLPLGTFHFQEPPTGIAWILQMDSMGIPFPRP